MKEGRPYAPSPYATPFNNATLQELRRSSEDGEIIRHGAEMLERNITLVFGEDLVRRFKLPVIRPFTRTNSIVDQARNYGRTAIIFAAGLGWDEGTPMLHLFSARVVMLTAQRYQDNDRTIYETLASDANAAINRYITDRQISTTDQKRVQLLIEYFGLDGNKKKSLRNFLDTGEIETFWSTLQRLVDSRPTSPLSPSSDEEPSATSQTRPDTSSPGRALKPVDRAAAQTWLGIRRRDRHP